MPLLVAVLLASAVVAVVVYKRSWQLVWHDDFTSPSINTSLWNVRNNSWTSHEESIATSRPNNVHQGLGDLTISAQRERYTVGGTTRNFTSGYLDTLGRASWKYGKFEMRARLPMAQGLWPAFWLRAEKGMGEIDILEAVGGRPRETTQSIHQSTNGGQGRATHDDTLPRGTIGDWHTYALTLEPDTVTWSIDDRVVFRVDATKYPWIHQTFDQPMNIRLNLQVGGLFPAYYQRPVTAQTQFPAQYVVDWVRVYQQR